MLRQKYYNAVWTHILRGSFVDLKSGTYEPFSMLPLWGLVLDLNGITF